MFNLFDDQLIDDAVLRAEQSRVSYNLQTEEFRSLNTNLQNYLGDIKIIDDDNHKLQENIEQIRTQYIIALENNLKRLPNDFRVQSQLLNDVHIERYKFKSRTRRFLCEREEYKQRINFVARNEKDQIKHLNILQKQERIIENELIKLNEQLQRLLKYVENEKQKHQQAMDKVDDLQIQLEQKCIERSKTEFEIQSLKEEVKLMQTTKEFLNEERETIISSQTEANEYLLSRLNDSINRIREDFEQLNKTQLEQIDNEYKQILQKLEENLLNNQTTNISQQTISSENERLENEYQSALQQLTILNDQNQILVEQVLAMETEIHSLRNERMQQLISKDNELELSKIELQTLNEKLNHLAEYDRNLKFELTLYRGVLESEYRRKQTSNNIPHLIRPTTLRTNKNSMTDRTTWLTSNTNQNKFNDQQEEEILTTDNRVQSDYDLLGEDTNGQINAVISTKPPDNDQKRISDESLWGQLLEAFNQEQQKDRANANIITQDTEKPSSSLLTVVSTEGQSTLPFEAQQSTSRTSSISTGTQKSLISSTPPILREDQSKSSQARQLPATPPELRSLPTISPSNQATSPINTIPLAFEVHQPSSTFSEEYQTLSEVQPESSPRTSSISTGTSSEVQKTPSLSISPKVLGDQLTSSQFQQSPSAPPQELQLSSHTSSISTGASTEVQKSPSSSIAPTVPEDQPTSSEVPQSPSAPPQELQLSSRTSSISTGASTEVQKSPSSSTAPTVLGDQFTSSQVDQSPSTPPQDPQLSSRTSSTSTGTSSEVQKSPSSSIAPTVPEDQPTFPEVQKSPSAPPQESQLSSRTSSISTRASTEVQKSPSSSTAPTVLGDQPTLSQVDESPSAPPQEPQLSSRTSSISARTPSDIQKSPTTVTTPIVPEYQPPTSDVHQLSSASPQEHQPPSRTSSISSKTSLDFQKSPLATTQISSEYQPLAIDAHQLSLIPPEEFQSSSRTSSISAKTSSDIQKSPTTVTTPIVPEYQPPTSDVHQISSTPPQEHQPSSRTSSISSKTSLDFQRSPLATTQISSEYEPLDFDAHQLSSTPPQENQPSSRTSSISSKTSSDIQKSPTTVTTPTVPEYQPPTSDVHQISSTPPQEHQPSSRTSSISSKTSLDFQRYPTTGTIPTVPQYQSSISDVHQSPSTPPEDRQAFLEFLMSPTANANVQGKTSSITADDYQITASIGEFGSENQLTKSFGEIDDNFQFEESTSYTTDDKAISEVDHNERRQSIQSIEPSPIKEFEISFQTKPNESESLFFTLASTPEEERKQNLSQSDRNISSEFKQDEISNQINREENISSSPTNQIEEDNSTHNISSAITSDPNLNEFNFLLPQDTSKQSSQNTSLTDIEEVDYSTSQKLEIKSDDDDDPNLAAIIRDLLYVFHELANDEELVEINNDLPDKILDRLEFRDHFIRTLFDGLIRKYLIQLAVELTRPETLDWVEFRDILFPIITGRYTERHIRKLFDLFDTSRDGYLSLQEISELLEVLHANDTIYLAQNIIDEFDTDHDGKLSVDELIDAIKKTDDINEHALSEETENKQWFNQSPIENQTITLQVPIVNFSSKIDDQFSKEISLLGRIFKRVGANFDSKQLDSNNKNLSMQITNEFINNNINISSDDLQLFIQLFLDKKQQTDSLINWIEFRDIFFPIINNGYYTKNHIKIWFDIFDTNQNGIITQQQVIQLLHLLKIQNSEEIIDIVDNNDSWTFDELIFVLDNFDETVSHLLTNNEQISSFDINWLSNNVF